MCIVVKHIVLKSQNIWPSETVVRAWKPKMWHSSI